ncbi:MAG: hypothetical protein J2P25_22145 [Nocardiopsaceae bacterium]|nr:hypothetical protein [Nocardiopsaceae bacterium]
MSTGENTDPEAIFTSNMIDVGDLDLSKARELPNAVLRAAVIRVCEELADGTGTLASWNSYLNGTRLRGEDPL